MQSSQSSTNETSRFVRTAALCCIIGSLTALVGAAITAVLRSGDPSTAVSSPYTPTLFSVTQIIWAVSYALILVGIVGVALTDAVGSSRIGKIGLWTAIAGQAALVVGNLGYAFFATANRGDAPIIFLDTLMGVGSVVTGLGMLVAGIVVLAAGRWQRWHRFIPLLCGLFVFVLLLPVLILELTIIEWPLAGWAACFLLLGIALYQQSLTPVGTQDAGDLDRRLEVTSQSAPSASGSVSGS